nr:DUF3298 and DUF4163 domain-containing protein [Pseudoxanthomonas kalamensis]
MTSHRIILAAVCLFALLAVAGCKPDSDSASPSVAPTAPVADDQAVPPAEPETVELKDVIETNDRYVIGISYPPGINRYPGLARAIGAYVQEAKDGLMAAVEGFGNDKPSIPYELSLNFEQVLDSPDLVAIAADGSRYTGGAHGEPLVARFVWLPKQDKALQADELIPGADGWMAISGYVREQLRTAVSVRADADEMAPEDRARLVRTANKVIDEGTEPDSDNFRQFQPLVDAQGKLSALRFVFPPYQVGPYADGTQSVDVPIEVLRPYLAPEYAGLFE